MLYPAHTPKPEIGEASSGDVTGTLSLNLKMCNDLHLAAPPCRYRLWGLTARQASPICLSTPVPLTQTRRKPILLGIEHCPTYRIGESLSKRWEG